MKNNCIPSMNLAVYKWIVSVIFLVRNYFYSNNVFWACLAGNLGKSARQKKEATVRAVAAAVEEKEIDTTIEQFFD